MKLQEKDSGDKDNDNDNEKEEEHEETNEIEDAKALGDPVRVSGKGRGRKRHYEFFEFDGSQYTLEDTVLLAPENEQQKPYVAIIKDIIKNCSGNIMVIVQWFYRPEEAKKKRGGSWKFLESRELFYSFHCDGVPAESIMNKCVVDFVPLHIMIPEQKEHPSFIVHQVYDQVEKILRHLTDKKYEDSQQHEINELVQQTLIKFGDDISYIDLDLDVSSEDERIAKCPKHH